MYEKELEKLNFEPKEASVYVAMLELGETSIERIARKAKVSRTSVYHIIDSLKDKGYVEMTKKSKKTFYYAQNPNRIGEMLDEKKVILNRIIPGLLSITNTIEKKPQIRYFEGTEGIREIYKDTLKYHNQETLVWTTEDVLKYFDADWLWDYYVVKRVENKIWQRTIAPDIAYAKELGEKDQKHLRQMKFISSQDFPMYVDITLYGGRFVGIMSFKDGIGLIIESEGVYKSLKSVFEINWIVAK